jgi:UDP-N-acetylglucosamine diphosphorylase/glucosamine-1-phosphate N-acetyltransferase
MAKKVILYEDAAVTNLNPFVWIRPVWSLRIGVGTLEDRFRRAYPQAAFAYWCRGTIEDIIRESVPQAEVNQTVTEDILLLNGRLLAEPGLAQKIPASDVDRAYRVKDTIVAARLSAETASRFKKGPVAEPEFLESLPSEEVSLPLIEYPWDLVRFNADAIVSDFESIDWEGRKESSPDKGAHLIDEKNIYLARGSRVMAGAVINGEEGPVVVDEGATVMHNAVVVGPAYIGRNSIIKTGAKIYEGTSIGEVCKVGGEVEESIIHSYSNKQHDGFLGHAYIGQWVNLGADTNNSDLKNNYSNVSVSVNGEMIDTGSMFAGLFMGDHAKAGINTMFNTGTVVGVGCNVFGGGFPDKSIPCFSWGGPEGFVEYRFDKFLEVARRVLARRGKKLTDAQEKVLKHCFEETREDRAQG